MSEIKPVFYVDATTLRCRTMDDISDESVLYYRRGDKVHETDVALYTESAIEALQKELGYSKMAADAEAKFADEYKAKFEAQKQRAYALALVINDLTRMVTYEGETKEDFIRRVKSILSVNPDLRVCELQKENAELKAEVKEWLCLDCNTVFPSESIPNSFSCLICPKCDGKRMPKNTAIIKVLQAESAAQAKRIAELEKDLVEWNEFKKIRDAQMQALRKQMS